MPDLFGDPRPPAADNPGGAGPVRPGARSVQLRRLEQRAAASQAAGTSQAPASQAAASQAAASQAPGGTTVTLKGLAFS